MDPLTLAEDHRPRVIKDRRFEFTRPRLYPKQAAAIYEPKRISCIEASTKSGKTAGSIVWFSEMCTKGLDGHNFWWVAPVYPQAAIAFRRMFRYLKVQGIRVRATQNPMCIFLPNGAVAWFKSGDNPDSLYGEDVFAAVIDEASRVSEESWHAVYSTLTYTGGRIRLIGNVKGRKNWFYQLARRGECDDPEVGAHKMTAWDAVEAGVLQKDAIESAERTLPPMVFRELFLAEASDDEGNPFGIDNIDACIQRTKVEGRPWVWGWDLAKSRDWTVGIALDREGACVAFHRFQKPWQETGDFIKRTVGKTPMVVDQTGVGDPIVERLQRDPAMGRNVQGYKYTGPSKQMLMEGLAVALSNREVSYPDGPIPIELRQFEYSYHANGVRYGAPEGFHDDCVCALAMAVWCRTHRVGGYDLDVMGG